MAKSELRRQSGRDFSCSTRLLDVTETEATVVELGLHIGDGRGHVSLEGVEANSNAEGSYARYDGAAVGRLDAVEGVAAQSVLADGISALDGPSVVGSTWNGHPVRVATSRSNLTTTNAN